MTIKNEVAETERQAHYGRHGSWFPEEGKLQDQQPAKGADAPARTRKDLALQAHESYTGPTYYGETPIKASKYEGLVWSYTYVAGLAGSAQVLATIADMTQRPSWKGAVRNGRYLAMLGPTVGSVLLIADLHTPGRWYNMLRIFRKTSPMSIGTYLLTTFGVTSGIAAAGQILGNVSGLRWLKPAATVAQVPAAIAGAGMSTYTAALISSTSTPLWAAAPRLVAARFACSSVATAAAALSIGETMRGERRNSDALDRLAAVATVADTALAYAQKREYQKEGVAGSRHDKRSLAAEHRMSNVLEHAIPLACYGLKKALPRHGSNLSVLAALGVLAGGMLMRSSLFHAGNNSARRSRDYFAFTQPRRHEMPDKTDGKGNGR